MVGLRYLSFITLLLSPNPKAQDTLNTCSEFLKLYSSLMNSKPPEISINKDKLFVKNNIIKVLDDLDLFTSSYSDNRNKYLEVKDNGQIDQIGYYRSFVFKTIENDKTPLSEIKKYIVELKKANNKI